MTPSLALAATITGTRLTLAPIQPADVRAAHQTIDPDAPMWLDPDVARRLDRLANADREIARHTAYLTAIDWHYDYATRNYFAWLDNARQARREIEEWLAAAYDVQARPSEPIVLETVPSKPGHGVGYDVLAIATGSPLPNGAVIESVTDAGSDTCWHVTDTKGREHRLHKYGRLLRYSSGNVLFNEPSWSGWASD